MKYIVKNGQETTVHENEPDFMEQIRDLVLHNDSVKLHVTQIDGVITVVCKR